MENRPKYLSDNIKFYSAFPQGYNMDVDYRCLPPMLNFDFHTLNGILPLTTSRFKYVGENGEFAGKKSTIIFVNPSEEEYQYFESIGVTEFQAISIVVNFYAVEEEAPKVLRGLPYSVSLVPMSKNNQIDTWNINLLRQSNLEELCQGSASVFTEFTPFKNHFGLVMNYSFFSEFPLTEYTDSIGFQWGIYFLNPVFQKNEIQMTENTTYSKEINAKYRKYKVNRYYKPFKDINPRQLWGCNSPIELFLLQGLYIRGIVPEIQMNFYKDGVIFPNYYKMQEHEIFVPEDKLITSADFYYPEFKLALFCDGKDFHDEERDRRIDESLCSIGVKSLRFSGKKITEDLEGVLNEIETTLQNKCNYFHIVT